LTGFLLGELRLNSLVELFILQKHRAGFESLILVCGSEKKQVDMNEKQVECLLPLVRLAQVSSNGLW
jgi:hypothetical protein